ncbi:MAG: hypothetical protein IKQ55_03790 [Kiritimatiellae bacterium]|nr:hypothetical protein [Kiritimatiellia bacterium]
MTEEQRRAMFARMNGGNAAAAARNPYKPEPVSTSEVLKGAWDGFKEGAVAGIANIFNSATFGLSDMVGMTHTYQQTGWDSKVSKIAAELGVMAASFAIGGAGAGGKTAAKGATKGAARATAEQTWAKGVLSEAEREVAKKGAEYKARNEAAEVAVREWEKARVRRMTAQTLAQKEAARKAEEAAFKKSMEKQALLLRCKEEQAAAVQELVRAREVATAVAKAPAATGKEMSWAARGLLEGKGVAHGYIAQDMTRSEIAKHKERKANEAYARRAYEIIHGEPLPKDREQSWFAAQDVKDWWK